MFTHFTDGESTEKLAWITEFIFTSGNWGSSADKVQSYEQSLEYVGLRFDSK